MSVPAITVIAAWILTWELSRMIRKKLAKRAKERARIIYCNLQEAYRYGLLDDDEFRRWSKMLQEAKAGGDSKFKKEFLPF